MPGLDDVRIIELPKFLDPRGNLSFIEEENHIPFQIKRTYWIYDVPGGEIRGSHAYKLNCEFVIALSGSFDVVLNDGKEERVYSLNRSYYGLYVPNMLWRTLQNFSTNALCLILASEHYQENDYIRNFDDFKKHINNPKFNININPFKLKGKEILLKEKNTNVYDCEVISLPKIHNRAGNITALDYPITIPYDIKRVYYLYDIPGGETRGGHAHKTLHQILIAASGSFDVLLDDGVNKKIINLNRPYYGLKIVPGIWRELINFSSGAICLVLASTKYDESDYIRDYDKFIKYKNDTSLI